MREGKAEKKEKDLSWFSLRDLRPPLVMPNRATCHMRKSDKCII